MCVVVYKPKNIEELRYGCSTSSKEEIDLCLNCPYDECKTKCPIIREFKKNDKIKRKSEK